MKIVFMGTPDFAVPCLESLIKNGNEIVGVFTQPDKKVGRKQIMTPPPVKVLAEKYGLTVFQPNTLKDGKALDIIKELAPDVIVVVAYGKILPKEILDYPKYGCVNVHASLLPKYRGSAPIQWAVINGETETGVTIMLMDEGIDTGDIILVRRTEIGINETSEELFDRLSVIGARALTEIIELFPDGNVNHVSQPDGDFGYAPMIDKSICAIDWNKSAFEVHNLIRGLQSWPVASTVLNGKTVKIHKSVLSDKTGNEAGEIVNNKNVLTVCCGDKKCVDILEIQPEGKKKMDIKAFLAGNQVNIGEIIGE